MRLFLTLLSLLFVTACSGDAAQALADYKTGLNYLQGTGVEKNMPQAVTYLTRAANGGNVDAELTLGYLFMKGNGVKKDDTRAFTLFRLAALQGNRDAEYNTGLSFVKGLGTPVDLKEAFAWFEKAALQDDAPSQYNLGVMYLNAEGVAQDASQAYAWFSEAGNKSYEGAKEGMAAAKQALTKEQVDGLDAVIAKVERQIRRQKASEAAMQMKSQPL